MMLGGATFPTGAPDGVFLGAMVSLSPICRQPTANEVKRRELILQGRKNEATVRNRYHLAKSHRALLPSTSPRDREAAG